MLEQRANGILCHITSLPAKYGIGDLGGEAYRFVDFLNQTKQKFWQVLPLNPTDGVYADSPYSSISAYATNTLLISPDVLIADGYLTKGDLGSLKSLKSTKVDYDSVRAFKQPLFDIAFKRFKDRKKSDGGYDTYYQRHARWLDDFALFVVIKEKVSQDLWADWPQALRDRQPEALEDITKQYPDEIEKVKFLQYIFYKQWTQLKEYANKKGVSIIGDIPIYVSYDSVDVWTSPGNYKLRDDKSPEFVAGVPPDYFSETGQRWGNPVYNWDVHKVDNFSWWLDRIAHNLELFDSLRIDHFRGLIAYWEIPSSEETAINGYWVGVPYRELFTALNKTFPKAAIIAEDLGIITDDVRSAMHEFGFPGMKVLLFAFNGDMGTHPYLPHNFTDDCVVYTGTHDNNTARGWYEGEATEQEKHNMWDYYQRHGASLKPAPKKTFTQSEPHWCLIHLAMSSRAKLSLIPLQDILGLGANERMNTPSTMESNWVFRYQLNAIDSEMIKRLSHLTKETRR